MVTILMNLKAPVNQEHQDPTELNCTNGDTRPHCTEPYKRWHNTPLYWTVQTVTGHKRDCIPVRNFCLVQGFQIIALQMWCLSEQAGL